MHWARAYPSKEARVALPRGPRQIEFNDRTKAAGIDPTILNFASGWGCSPDLESELSSLELNARIDLEGDDNVRIDTFTDFVVEDGN